MLWQWGLGVRLKFVLLVDTCQVLANQRIISPTTQSPSIDKIMFSVGVAIARSDNNNRNRTLFNRSRNCAMVSEIIVGFA